MRTLSKSELDHVSGGTNGSVTAYRNGAGSIRFSGNSIDGSADASFISNSFISGGGLTFTGTANFTDSDSISFNGGYSTGFTSLGTFGLTDSYSLSDSSNSWGLSWSDSFENDCITSDLSFSSSGGGYDTFGLQFEFSCL